MICKQKLYKTMDNLGFAEALPGTEYIRAGVAMVDAKRSAMMCKDIYPALSKAANTSPAAIERAMRTAISRATRSPNWEYEWRSIGGWNQPSNSEVIRRLARECSVED